ncbi:DUF2800 domain-containing protein [Comamonas antarctica]|uniref:DUF2800 domain-containing protein n=1 Tax=Comamonas antarctica TaxID=2743470 RepID=UPI0028EB73AE|nr:DUF2800 domain-containing protein [Comamonas antarctica]
MGKYHAKLSPSSADRWTSCTASVKAQAGLQNKNSDASREGTTCHQMLEEIVLGYIATGEVMDAQNYAGQTLSFWQHAESDSSGETWQHVFTEQDLQVLTFEAHVVVTEDMADAVNSAVAFIVEQHKLRGGTLMAERAVPIGQFTGEVGATGTTDLLLFGETWMLVADGKFGRKPVNASRLISPASIDLFSGKAMPEKRGPNLQMANYALGAIHEYDLFGTVKDVTMVILQPMIGRTDSYSCTIEELRETEQFLARKAQEVKTNPQFAPSFEACFFCLAKGRCDAQSTLALSSALDGFGEADTAQIAKPNPLTLGSQFALVPFVLKWAADVEEAVREALNAGERVVRNDGQAYKLVAGKAGPRQWKNEQEVEEFLRKLRLTRDQMYSQSVISPTAAEKLAKPVKVKKGETAPPPVLGPRQWEKLQEHIVRGNGAPAIALETDPKPALNNAIGFEDVAT